MSIWTDLLLRLNIENKIELTPNGVSTEKGTRITREFDPQLRKAVWTKQFNLVERDDKFCFRPFSKWENDLVSLLKQSGISTGPKPITSSEFASAVNNGLTPEEERDRGGHTLITYDMGPPLHLWGEMKPFDPAHGPRGCTMGHSFVRTVDFLRLIKHILSALKPFHEGGFQHCDLHSGNLALPASFDIKTDASVGEYILVKPDWFNLGYLDLDSSTCARSAPPAILTHKCWAYVKLKDGQIRYRISDHLRLRLLTLDALLNVRTSNPTKLLYDVSFWGREHTENRCLDCLTTLDWREDLYQLGVLLAQIRDQWGGGSLVHCGGNPQITLFITRFPERLMAWGDADQLGGIETNELDRAKVKNDKGQDELESYNNYHARLQKLVEKVELLKVPERPHRAYIAEIDDLLRNLPQEPTVWVFRRIDNDPDYKKQQQAERQKEEDRLAQDRQRELDSA